MTSIERLTISEDEMSSSSSSEDLNERSEKNRKEEIRDNHEASFENGSSIIGRGTGVAIEKVLPMNIRFEKLSYGVKVKVGKAPWSRSEEKVLLKDIYGEFKPGQVTAIMGPSGAGKTTLLNILAGRTQAGKIRGKIFLNNQPRNKLRSSKWKRLSGYVTQDDVMSSFLSPRESFHFSAAFRLPTSIGLNRRRRKERVEALIEELGLEECAATRIGDVEKKGISGGQRKRASIGIELITDPSVVFLDEPTSGLDSHTSYSLTLSLKKLAECGRTIITTIHQPSSDIFFSFDQLILLSKGHIIFSGPTSEVVQYFSKIGFKCPKYTNPAEYIMNLASVEHGNENDTQRFQTLVKSYRDYNGLPEWNFEDEGTTEDKAEEKQGNKADEDDLEEAKGSIILRPADSPASKSNKASQQEEISKGKGPNALLQFCLVIFRSFLVTIRDPMSTFARLVQTIFFALLVGLLFLDLGTSQTSVQDREGALFFITVNIVMGTLFNTIILFPAERVIFIREHANGSYSTLPYYLGKSLSDIPFQVTFPFLFSLISYWMCGFQNDADKFFTFVAALMLLSLTAQSVGLAISTGVSNIGVSLAFAPMVFVPMMLVGGFFLNNGSVPDWAIWAKYISPFKWAFEILVLNEFNGLTFNCTPTDCKYPTGEDAIASLGLNNSEDHIYSCFLVLIGLMLSYRTLGYVMLRLTAARKKL